MQFFCPMLVMFSASLLAAPAQAQTAVSNSFSGPYAGALAGAGNEQLADEYGTVKVNGGALGGLMAGYGFRFGPLVVGAEVDLLGGRIGGDPSFANLTPLTNVNFHLSSSLLATVRARFGFTDGITLVYATGGGAHVTGTLAIDIRHAPMKARTAARVAASSPPGDHNDFGFVLGGGIEHHLTPRLTGRIEALRYEFDRLGGTEWDQKSTSFKAGLAWYFN